MTHGTSPFIVFAMWAIHSIDLLRHSNHLATTSKRWIYTACNIKRINSLQDRIIIRDTIMSSKSIILLNLNWVKMIDSMNAVTAKRASVYTVIHGVPNGKIIAHSSSNQLSLSLKFKTKTISLNFIRSLC